MNGTTRDSITALFAQFAGQDGSLVIPRPYIDFCQGDHLAALLLSQILYWSDRTDDPEGWFAKSYEDWRKELCMTDYQVKRAVSGDKRRKNGGFCLEDIGVETKLKQSKYYGGAAALHYRINQEKLTQAVLVFLDSYIVENERKAVSYNVEDRFPTKSKTGSLQSRKRSTKITTKTTKITDAPSAVSAGETSSPDISVVEDSQPEERFGFHIGQDVYWAYEHRGGYGYVTSVESKIVRFTAKRVVISAKKRDQKTWVEKTVAPSSLRLTPHNFKTLNDLTDEQRVIAIHSFKVKPGQGIGKSTMELIGCVISELRTAFGFNGEYPTPTELETCFRRCEYPPNVPAKVVKMVNEHRPARPTQEVSALKDSHLRARKDCEHCGGTGQIVSAEGKVLLCVCVQEADHAAA